MVKTTCKLMNEIDMNKFYLAIYDENYKLLNTLTLDPDKAAQLAEEMEVEKYSISALYKKYGII